MIEFKDTDDLIDEIIDVLDRTYFYAEMPNAPTKFQKWISKTFFGVEWRSKVRPTGNEKSITQQLDDMLKEAKEEVK
jgi:hypothetical protein